MEKLIFSNIKKRIKKTLVKTYKTVLRKLRPNNISKNMVELL